MRRRAALAIYFGSPTACAVRPKWYVALLAGCFVAAAAHSAEPAVTALVGGTIIDVSQGGRSTHDIGDSVILLQGARITAVGTHSTVVIPPGAAVVHIEGKFVIPGLVDGFCGMRNQAEANAELYEGVTTIGATGDDRRGALFLAADPSPHIYPVDSAGTTDDWSLLRGDPAWRDVLADGADTHELTPAETADQIDETRQRGTRVLWIGHNITTENTAAIIAQARRQHVVTYGEFVATPYQAGIADGVTVLLHMSRLELGLAPLPFQREAATDPEGRGAAPAYAAVDAIDPRDPIVAQYADMIASNHVAIMPTFSLYYALLPGRRNLWREPAAAILDPRTMGTPSDRATGDLPFPDPAVRASMQNFAEHSFALDRVLIAHHVPVLAASGASWQGTLPGISLHTEMELLVRAGLTPRAAIAAGTGNYAEILGWSELGRVAAGRRADLVVLDADPTLDVGNADRIESVYLLGQKLDRNALLRKNVP